MAFRISNLYYNAVCVIGLESFFDFFIPRISYRRLAPAMLNIYTIIIIRVLHNIVAIRM